MDSSDQNLWAKTIQECKPLKKRNPVSLPKIQSPHPQYAKQRMLKGRAQSGNQISHQTTHQLQALNQLPPHANNAFYPNNDHLSKYHQSGLDRRSAMRLARGQMKISATLDLHGFNRIDAKARLEYFILTERQKNTRCVLVITGKGQGILQQHLPLWLSTEPLNAHILNFTPATIKHGGSGAFYVLIRRLR
ncbi:MAG: Smr/MutS family protein [Pseudomonadota bacterium]